MKPYTLHTQSSHKYTAGFSIRHLALLFILLLAVTSSSITTLAAAPATHTSTEAEASTKNTAGKKKKSKSIKITISAAGDCTLGVDSRYNNTFNNYYKKKAPLTF